MSSDFSILSDNDDLPTGWEIVTLEEIGNWGSGGTPRKGTDEYYGGNIPWLKISDINDDVVYQSEEHITELGLKESSAKLLPPDVLLIAMYGSIGKLGITGIECATNQAIAFCYPNKEIIHLKYLFFCLRNFRNNLIDLGKGGTQQNISQTVLKVFEIPLAPLNEQRRIVEKVEALMARSRKAKEALDAIPKLIEQFRQSVLAAAFRGDLTADWREQNPNIEPASVLLEHIRKERREKWASENRGKFILSDDIDTENLPLIPKNWIWTTLDELLISLRNGLSKPPTEETTGIPILRISAVRPMEVNLKDIRYYQPIKGENLDYYLLKDGDLLFTRYNGSKAFVGVCGMVNKLTEKRLYPDKLIRCKLVNTSLCLPEYIEIACNFGASRNYIENHAKTSAGQHGISGSDLKSTPIPLPPFSEQVEIVTQLKKQFSITTAQMLVASSCAQSIGTLNQSILSKAFRGELVEQDPNDEPASVLLERIQKEREKEKTKVKQTGAKKLKK
jgi:type I restriction enzyme S subunit